MIAYFNLKDNNALTQPKFDLASLPGTDTKNSDKELSSDRQNKLEQCYLNS